MAQTPSQEFVERQAQIADSLPELFLKIATIFIPEDEDDDYGNFVQSEMSKYPELFCGKLSKVQKNI